MDLFSLGMKTMTTTTTTMIDVDFGRDENVAEEIQVLENDFSWATSVVVLDCLMNSETESTVVMMTMTMTMMTMSTMMQMKCPMIATMIACDVDDEVSEDDCIDENTTNDNVASEQERINESDLRDRDRDRDLDRVRLRERDRLFER
jgi:hypothetical protein